MNIDNAKPILFSTPMVQAILAGRKTQTRRVIKLPSLALAFHTQASPLYFSPSEKKHYVNFSNADGECCKTYYPQICPGDILWVRETWDCVPNSYNDTWDVVYAADGEQRLDITIPDFDPMLYKPARWRPSIHMPREAARIFLRVTDVRAERLQDISHLDCLSEGIRTLDDETAKQLHELDVAVRQGRAAPGRAATAGHLAVTNLYHMLWDSLNAKRGYGWDANPWVWVYTFERHDAPVR